MQIDVYVHIPLVVSVVIVVESDDHVRKMTGLVVVVVGGVGSWADVQNAANANEGSEVASGPHPGAGITAMPEPSTSI